MPKFSARNAAWLRLIAFFILPALVIAASNRLLIPVDRGSYYSFYELSEREDVELALIGSSVVHINLNPNLITEQTGLETHSVSVGCMSLPGALAAARLMYETNSPKYVCLVVEPDNFNTTVENIQTQRFLHPHFKNPMQKAHYYLDTCSQDGKYIERLLLFRSFMDASPESIRNGIALRRDPEHYYHASGFADSGYYRGRGYYREDRQGDGAAALRAAPVRIYADGGDDVGIRDYSYQKMLEFKALCDQHGSQLIIATAPNLMANAVARYGFAQKHVELGQFCQQNDIPYLNLFFAKESFMPRLDDHFYDITHLGNAGADILSEKLSELLEMYIAGESYDHLFYQTTDEFMASIHGVLSVFVDPMPGNSGDLYKATCLHGADVTPLYSFHLVNSDGSTTCLQDYGPSDTYACSAGTLRGKTLRVLAREDGNDASPVVYYDLKI